MEGLQRSAVSFRRQGSSGLIWDDNLLKAEIDRFDQRKANQDQTDDGSVEKEKEPENDAVEKLQDELKPIKTVGSANTMERSRSNGGGRAYRTGKVSPAIDPPSPKVSACGFCGGAFGKRKEARGQRKPRSGKRKV